MDHRKIIEKIGRVWSRELIYRYKRKEPPKYNNKRKPDVYRPIIIYTKTYKIKQHPARSLTFPDPVFPLPNKRPGISL